MSEEHEHINDLWEDMDRLNALYEELCWDCLLYTSPSPREQRGSGMEGYV